MLGSPKMKPLLLTFIQLHPQSEFAHIVWGESAECAYVVGVVLDVLGCQTVGLVRIYDCHSITAHLADAKFGRAHKACGNLLRLELTSEFQSSFIVKNDATKLVCITFLSCLCLKAQLHEAIQASTIGWWRTLPVQDDNLEFLFPNWSIFDSRGVIQVEIKSGQRRSDRFASAITPAAESAEDLFQLCKAEFPAPCLLGGIGANDNIQKLGNVIRANSDSPRQYGDNHRKIETSITDGFHEIYRQLMGAQQDGTGKVQQSVRG